MTWRGDSVKGVLVRIEVMIVKLRGLWLRTTMRMMIKRILEKKIGN